MEERSTAFPGESNYFQFSESKHLSGEDSMNSEPKSVKLLQKKRPSSSTTFSLTWTPIQLAFDEFPSPKVQRVEALEENLTNYQEVSDVEDFLPLRSTTVTEDIHGTRESQKITDTGSKTGSDSKYPPLLHQINKEIKTKAAMEIIYSCQKCEFILVVSDGSQARIIPAHALGHLTEPAFFCHICGFQSNYMRQHMEEAHGKTKCSIQMKPQFDSVAIRNLFECFPALDNGRSENFTGLKISETKQFDSENEVKSVDESFSPSVLSSDHCAVCSDNNSGIEILPTNQKKMEHSLIHCSTSGQTLTESVRSCFPLLSSVYPPEPFVPDTSAQIAADNLSGIASDSRSVHELVTEQEEEEKRREGEGTREEDKNKGEEVQEEKSAAEEIKIGDRSNAEASGNRTEESEMYAKQNVSDSADEKDMTSNAHERIDIVPTTVSASDSTAPNKIVTPLKIRTKKAVRFEGVENEKPGAKSLKLEKEATKLDAPQVNKSRSKKAIGELKKIISASQVPGTLYPNIVQLVTKLMKHQIGFSNTIDCDKCSKVFTNNGGIFSFNVIRHLMTHLSVPLYYCDICGSEISDPRPHGKLHPGLNPVKINGPVRPESESEAINNLIECFPDYSWICQYLKQLTAQN